MGALAAVLAVAALLTAAGPVVGSASALRPHAGAGRHVLHRPGRLFLHRRVNGNGLYDSLPCTPTVRGTYKWRASFSGDANNNGSGPTSCLLDPNESVTVTAPPPVNLTTVVSPAVPVGGTVNDTATLTGGTSPTGTITFSLFGPNNANCVGAPIFTSTVATATSAAFIPAGSGTYRWVAAYSGDANNALTMGTCSDPSEIVFVSVIPTPTIITLASQGTGVGGEIHDSAVLAVDLITGAVVPTGTLTYSLFGPDDATYAGTPVFVSTVAVVAGAPANSASFVPPAAGTYRWVATYSGDASNGPAGPTACGDPTETVTVTALPLATPRISTTASPSVMIGGAIHDTAIVSGGNYPTGIIVFFLSGPDEPTCGSGAFIPQAVVINGNGSYESAPKTPTVPGSRRWP